MALRDFLYLDRELVRDFLAQAEGGLVDEATERQTATGKGGLGGKVGAGPVAVSGEKSKERSFETEAVVKQVAASEFDRLYSLLEGDDLVVFDEVSGTEALGQVRRKQFLEVDGRVQLSGIQKMMELMSTFSDLVPVMQQIGADVDIDKDAMAGIQAMSTLSGSEKSVPVIVTVPGDAQLQVGLELKRAGVLKETWDVDASALFKVQRVLRSNERAVIGDAFGGLMKALPQKERDKMIRSLKSDDLAQFGISDIEIQAPAFIGTPIAIYR